jgi:hypothetical protein
MRHGISDRTGGWVNIRSHIYAYYLLFPHQMSGLHNYPAYPSCCVPRHHGSLMQVQCSVPLFCSKRLRPAGWEWGARDLTVGEITPNGCSIGSDIAFAPIITSGNRQFNLCFYFVE